LTTDEQKEIKLTMPQVSDKPEENVTIDPALGYSEAPAPAVTVLRPKAPRGFSYGRNGGVYATKVEKDGEGKDFTKEVQVLEYDLFVVDLLKQDTEHIVHLVAARPDETLTVTMPQKAVVSKDETVKCLAAQNIIASYGQANDKNLFDYVRASVNEASLTRKVINVPMQAGWQKDGSFVYNNRVFTKEGGETTIPMPGLEKINKNTNSTGTLEGWRAFWNLMIHRKMDTMLTMCLDAFGAPLMKFTEFDGFVWHIGSTESGTGKSLTLSAKAAVWGHPVGYRTGKGTSPVAMQNRAGLLNSLPLLIDEITSKSRADLEWAPAFIFDITEGQGKERMESGANKERINNSTWSTTCTMTSNTHLSDYMSGARKHSSNGELLRMLEWTPNIPLEWTGEEREVVKAIKHNYGVAGEAWVRWLVPNQDTARDVVKKASEMLKKEINFIDDERYWHAGCTTILAAAILLGPQYSNILKVPVNRVIAALKALVESARLTLRRNTRTAEDVLNMFVRDNYGSFVVIKKDKTAGRVLAELGDGGIIGNNIPRNKVLGRVEHELREPGYIDFFIEEQLLKQHCVSMSFGYADFKKQIEALFPGVSYVKKDMLAKTGGPTMRVNVMHIHRKADEADEAIKDIVPVDGLEAD